MSARTPLVAGNWKMNGLKAGLSELEAIAGKIGGAHYQAALCVPATLIAAAAQSAAGSALLIGGEDCHAKASGAHTGDISAEMIADAGGKLVLAGHSERRTDHAETDAMVNAKVQAAWRAGLLAVICIGETEAERRSGATNDVLTRQIAGSVPAGWNAVNTVVAYEPVWAIGTGLTPSEGDIAAAHAHIRARLALLSAAEAAKLRILYGGSVKPSNAATILSLPDVDGALVGGASLKAADFLGIAAAYA